MVAGSNPGGNPIDGESISKNLDGEIQVEKPSDVVLGDFESGYGDWSTNLSTGGGSSNISSNQSHLGSQSVYLEEFGSGNISRSSNINRDFDASNQDTLKVYVYVTQVDGGNDIKVNLDNTTEIQDSSISTNTWIEYEIDVSGYSGTTSLEIVFSDTSSSSGNTIKGYIDDVRLTKPSLTKFNGAGN
ncbi:MAG: hypothetical protein ACI8Z7_000191 [Candidatus Nanohaloarchaea archaeon]|jgi:hypothetical protein